VITVRARERDDVQVAPRSASELRRDAGRRDPELGDSLLAYSHAAGTRGLVPVIEAIDRHPVVAGAHAADAEATVRRGAPDTGFSPHGIGAGGRRDARGKQN